MISIFDMVYVSIESRKGGVGKTTTALTLAETLLGADYQVLMIDLYIVGTTIDTTFINANDGLIHEVKMKGEPVNLVKLFKEVYMAGKNVPSFVHAENKANSFSFKSDKCNFIGSNIYDIPEGKEPLEDPRMLYDAFHAYWMLEYVKGIAKSFVTAVGQETKVAVILDNSPGFSSIENCIHDYLTELGPKEGKILLVSTIDPQDIEACRQSVKIVESQFKDKVAAGVYYRSMIKNGDGKKRDTPAFKSVWNSLCASDGRLPAYHARHHDDEPKFVSVLVNKVPQTVFEQLFAKGILHRESEVASPFQNHLIYYFSGPQLTANEIMHRQSYLGNFDEYHQSGIIDEIEQDNTRYLGVCEFFRQRGLGGFFKEDWAPKARFNDIALYLKGQETLKEQPEWRIVPQEGEFVSKENKIADEVRLVERYVVSNLYRDARLKGVMSTIDQFVTSVLSNIDDKEINFHPDHPRLQEIEGLVTNFGLAAYRLHIYKHVSDMFNTLISYCLEDIENIEKLDKDSLSSWIDDVLDGGVVEKDVVESLMRKLDDRKNARELRKSLQDIIRPWGL